MDSAFADKGRYSILSSHSIKKESKLELGHKSKNVPCKNLSKLGYLGQRKKCTEWHRMAQNGTEWHRMAQNECKLLNFKQKIGTE